MKGKTFWKQIMVLDGWHLNDPEDPDNYDDRHPKWTVLPNMWGPPEKWSPYGFKEEDCDRKEYVDNRTILQRLFSLYWKGLWPIFDLYSYSFTWTEERESSNLHLSKNEKIVWENKEKTRFIVSRTETVQAVRFRHPYAIVTDRAQTGMEGDGKSGKAENISLQVISSDTFQTRNAKLMLFEAGDWFKQATAAVISVTRDVTANNTWDSLNLLQNESGDKESLVEKKYKINEKAKGFNNGIGELFGVVLADNHIIDIEPVGEAAQKAVQASLTLFVARKEKEAASERGEGKGMEYKNEMAKRTDADKDYELEVGSAKNKILKENYETRKEAPSIAMADAIANHEGTLVLGSSMLPTLQLDNPKKSV